MTELFRYFTNDKIGNLLIYLAEKASNVTITKALKLLYLIDERAYKETGVPVTWLKYTVWEHGPVADDIWNELRRDQVKTILGKEISLEEFVTIKQIESDGKKHYFLIPNKVFTDDDFSGYELELIDSVIAKYGNWTSKDLVDELHKVGSLWHDTVVKHDLGDILQYKKWTDQPIDFFRLFERDEAKVASWVAATEAMKFKINLISSYSSPPIFQGDRT